MTKIFAAVVGAALVASAVGECQNGCSAAGICGQNDQCICYQGFRGNACEKRVCPYGKAWVTTPNGDINYDGDLYDSAVYGDNTRFSTRRHVVSQNMAGGTWEHWPANAPSGEGHFMMECSNMGICDQESGQCVCFDGFEGYACDRMTCPGGNTCSGHGRCMTIDQQISASGSAATYTLWDKDMARRCKCDPGYTGIDCTKRVCPTGDDPLTKIHQTDDLQIIEIYSDTVTDLATGGDLGGSFKLTFTSPQGHSFTTSSITFARHTGANQDVATATKAALEALPNGMIPSVTVTQGFCEKTLFGSVDDDYVPAGTAVTTFMRCPTALKNTDSLSRLIFDKTNTLIWAINGQTGHGLSVGGAAADFAAPVHGCTVIDKPRCTRLYVQFTDAANSGPQSLLSVDVSEVTLNSLTNVQRSNAGDVSATVVKDTSIVNADAAGTVAYVPATDILVTGTFDANALEGVTSITLPAALTAGAGDILPINSVVNIICAGTDMGDYIIAATVTAATSTAFTITQAFSDPHDKCNAGAFTIQGKTNYITVSADLQNTNLASVGAAVKIASTTITSTVSYISYDSGLGMGFLLLSELPVGISAIASGAANVNTLKFNGAGTKEANTCSDRGNCDYETGECNCFKGYSGEACQNQNALWLGA